MKLKLLLGALTTIACVNAHAGLIETGFDDSTGVTVSGSAAITGGVARLTQAANSQQGSVIFDSTDSAKIDGFGGSFEFTLSNAFNGGADGISFGLFDSSAGLSFVSGIAEEGSTTGISVGFDTWPNGTFDTSANSVSLRYNGMMVSQVNVTDGLFQFDQGSTYDVNVNFFDGLFSLDVSTGGTTLNVFNDVNINGWEALDGQFYFAGRTGGAGNLQVVDNVLIKTQAVSVPGMIVLFVLGFAGVVLRRFK